MLVTHAQAAVVGTKWEQVPNPNGWDVAFTNVSMLADDWQCWSSGPVSDIHFWYSWKGDNVGTISSISARIYSDVPASGTTPSHPGDLLWSLPAAPFSVKPYGSGKQGWFDPGVPASNRPDDHTQIYLATIDNISDPFRQEARNIYWLALKVNVGSGEQGGPEIGWKTSYEHFQDDAVFTVFATPSGDQWLELIDRTTGKSLDLAFAITTIPEPVSIVIWGLGAAGAAGAMALRRRKNTRARWSDENRQAIVGLIENRRKG
jgi:hypothetical protein